MKTVTLVFGLHQGARVLEHESGIEDLAAGEDLDIIAGDSRDVQYKVIGEPASVDSAVVTNAREMPVEVELRLDLAAGENVVRADQALHMQHGKPTFTLKIPARSMLTVHYQTRTSM